MPDASGHGITVVSQNIGEDFEGLACQGPLKVFHHTSCQTALLDLLSALHLVKQPFL